MLLGAGTALWRAIRPSGSEVAPGRGPLAAKVMEGNQHSVALGLAAAAAPATAASHTMIMALQGTKLTHTAMASVKVTMVEVLSSGHGMM